MAVETQRLVLQPPRLADAATLFTFLGDPKAMQYAHADRSLRECRRRVAVHEWCRRRNGCAPWTIQEKTDSRIIGWGGLYVYPFDTGWGQEVGYFFHPSAWGRGYASELVAACVRIADEDQLLDVRAFAHPENAGSQRVLEKNGFEKVRLVPRMRRFLYRRRCGSVPPASPPAP